VVASGWPAERDLPDAAWMYEVSELRDRMFALRGLRGRPTDLLRALASPALAAATAFLVQATVRRTPVLLDGPGAAGAAMLARRTRYGAVVWWRAAQLSGDPVHERTLTSLELTPLTRLGIPAENGAAARAGLALLDLAATLLGTGPVQDPDQDGTGGLDPHGPDAGHPPVRPKPRPAVDEVVRGALSDDV
jgi:nicotinate-nucleotide--dimethylbenzimidazole phosphoribosyltransferase